MPTQRDVMRDLYQRLRGDTAAVVREYAAAERRGEVGRWRNDYGLAPEEYAERLLADARRKGWIPGYP